MVEIRIIEVPPKIKLLKIPVFPEMSGLIVNQRSRFISPPEHNRECKSTDSVRIQLSRC